MAPVGGTMWAASPARKSRPYRIGSATKLRNGAIDFSIDGPVTILSAISGGNRRFSSPQNRSSGHSSISRREAALDVVAAEHRIAARRKGETALVARINDVADRRRLRHDPQPAERIGALESPQHRRRNALPRDAMETVAAGDEIASDGMGPSGLLVGDLRLGVGKVNEADILRPVDDAAAFALADAIELLGDRRLPVRPHRLAAVLDRVDQKRLAILPGDEASIVGVAFMVHPLAQTRLAQKLHRSRLEDSGADPPEHMRFRLPLDARGCRSRCGEAGVTGACPRGRRRRSPPACVPCRPPDRPHYAPGPSARPSGSDPRDGARQDR